MSEIEKAAEIIKSIQYLVLATADATGKPWNSPVRRVYDGDLNFYWFSDKESQHSRNVGENEQVFLVLFDSTLPEGKHKGVYFEATATEVEDPEIITVARRLKDKNDDPTEFLGEAVRRVYKATPSRAWVNGAEFTDGKYIRDIRVELNLAELQEAMR
jgi:nitroimidazol reductase NimA-like FMN-containing flavoprotein (pyridoxamine 5'-phosphate oxidase superfamily)